MLVRQLHWSWRRTCFCFRLQHVVLRQQSGILWWPKPPKCLQQYQCPSDYSPLFSLDCRFMEISRMLQVSNCLHPISVRSSPVLFFSISDNVGGRTLANAVGVSSNTIESCTLACYNGGYTLAGMEYSAECWCGTSIQAGGAPASATDCNMLCSGNSTEYCGGPNRLTLYNYTGTPSTTPPPTRTDGLSPVTGLPGNWTYNGCWT